MQLYKTKRVSSNYKACNKQHFNMKLPKRPFYIYLRLPYQKEVASNNIKHSGESAVIRQKVN